MKRLNRYDLEDEELPIPVYLKPLAAMFRASIDETQEKYDTVIEKRKTAAAQRWQKNIDKPNANDANGCKPMQTDANRCTTMQTDAIYVSVSDSVSDSVSVSVDSSDKSSESNNPPKAPKGQRPPLMRLGRN